MSSSTVWKEAQKIRSARFGGKSKKAVFIHLGDHDPSGIDMTRDNISRLELYSRSTEGHDFYFKRIALNMDQVEEYNPPPNPAKVTDRRFNGYALEYGYESWELDALDPDILVKLIQDEINAYKDNGKWAEMKKQEAKEKAQLKKLSDNWDAIIEEMENQDE